MWTNTAFGIYMGLHDAVTATEFEPARRREVLLGGLADAHCPEPAAASERAPRPAGPGSIALGARAGRRLARG